MRSLRADVEAAAAVSAVGKPLTTGPSRRLTSVVGHHVTLTDGTEGRLFVLVDPERTPVFTRLCREWAQVSDVAGITGVLARSEGPTPWVAVEGGGDELRRRSGAATARRVATSLAETLYRAAPVHGAVTPAHVSLTATGEPRLDWALGRLAVVESETAPSIYQAPELATGLAARDERTDTYGLGAVAWWIRAGGTRHGSELQRWVDATDSDRGLAAVCRRALAPEPADRQPSPYAFKQALLFGEQASAGPPRAEPPEDEASRADEPADEDATSSGGLTRRRALGAAGLAVVGGVGLVLGAPGGPDPPPRVSAAARRFESEYDGGLAVLEYTGGDTLDPAAITITGEGIGTNRVTELTWADVEQQPVTQGSSIALAATRGYRLSVDTPDEPAVTLTGPATEGSTVASDRLPIPKVSFDFDYREDRAVLQPLFERPVQADHLHVTATGDGETNRQRWHELAGTAPSQTVPTAGPVVLPAGAAVILRVTWAPPYFETERRLAQYTGPNRPKTTTETPVTYPQYNGQNTGSTGLSGSSTSPERAWTVTRAETAVDHDSVVVDQGRVVVASQQDVSCLDVADGRELWRTAVDARTTLQPVVWNGLVFVGTISSGSRQTSASAVAVNLATGDAVWEFTTNHQVVTTPYPMDGAVVTGGTGTAAPAVYRVEPGTGNDPAVLAERSQQARPAVDGTRAYLNTLDGLLAVTEAGIEWSFDRAATDAVPTAAAGGVYVVASTDAGDGRTVVRLDAADGTVTWESAPQPLQRTPSLAVADGTAFVGGTDETVRAISRTGQHWVAETGPQTGAPVVVDGAVYASTAEGLLALDSATGERRWSLSVDGRPLTPAVTTDRIFLRTADGTVSGFVRER